jgi:hypothetical protein
MLVCTAALAAAEDTNTIDRFKIFNDGDVLLVPVEGNVYSFTIDTGFAKPPSIHP